MNNSNEEDSMKTIYKYETHLHTCEGSACGHTPGEFYPQYYKDRGYAGIFITDHFFNGNCRISREGSWEERVEAFCKGYENAKKAGDQIGLSVFFGWESRYDGDEFLIYGLDKEWLLAHPEIMTWDRTQQYENIHKAGGLVVQAHPFRERDYIDEIRLSPQNCDAAEAYNASNDDYHNWNAEKYCQKYNLFMTAGSDNHKIGSLSDDEFFCMGFEHPLKSGADYVKAILNREGKMVLPEQKRLESCPVQDRWYIQAKLPVYEHNNKEEVRRVREWEDKLKHYSILNESAKKGEILFTGSSLMEQFPVTELKQNVGIDRIIYNRGVSGYTTDDMLMHMEEQIFGTEPSKIFINIGTNDIGKTEHTFEENLEHMLKNYEEILRQTKERLPNAKIYLMAYYPVNETADCENWPDAFKNRNNTNIKKANEEVEKLAKKLGLAYIDVNEGLTDENGRLKMEYTIEGVHMYANGYEKVLENLKPYLE